jgi:uncharacterized DUF497 family protein
VAYWRITPSRGASQRFVTLGVDAAGALLVVVYTYRSIDSIRLISAWKADRAQRKQYEARRR